MHGVLLLSLDDVVLSTRDSLEDDVEDSRPQEAHVDANCLQVLTEGRETPLEAKVVVLAVFVLDEVLVLLVDGVVGQVHVLVVFVELGSVSLRGEPGQALLVDVHSQRLVASHNHIDAQVKLVAIDQQRVSDVARDDRQLVDVQIVDVVDDVDSSASG